MPSLRHVALLVSAASACIVPAATPQEQPPPPEWESVLADTVPLFGHRNWICIVDSAYPAQSADGILTIATGEDQLAVVEKVLAALDAAPHVYPNVLVDLELADVPEEYAEGVTEYRDALDGLLEDQHIKKLPHEEIIAMLDEAAQTFEILILKTDMTLPYTSVFLQLECGYWTPEAEQALRDAMPDSEEGE